MLTVEYWDGIKLICAFRWSVPPSKQLVSGTFEYVTHARLLYETLWLFKVSENFGLCSQAQVMVFVVSASFSEIQSVILAIPSHHIQAHTLFFIGLSPEILKWCRAENKAFWFVTPCWLMKRYRLFEGSHCLRHHGQAVELLDPEYKGSVILRNVGEYFATDTAYVPLHFNLQQPLLGNLRSHGSTDVFRVVNYEQKAKDTL